MSRPKKKIQSKQFGSRLGEGNRKFFWVQEPPPRKKNKAWNKHCSCDVNADIASR